MRLARPLMAAALLTLGGCYSDPNEQLDQMQQALDLGNALEELNAKTSALQFTMDSLRGVRYVR